MPIEIIKNIDWCYTNMSLYFVINTGQSAYLVQEVQAEVGRRFAILKQGEWWYIFGSFAHNIPLAKCLTLPAWFEAAVQKGLIVSSLQINGFVDMVDRHLIFSRNPHEPLTHTTFVHANTPANGFGRTGRVRFMTALA